MRKKILHIFLLISFLFVGKLLEAQTITMTGPVSGSVCAQDNFDIVVHSSQKIWLTLDTKVGNGQWELGNTFPSTNSNGDKTFTLSIDRSTSFRIRYTTNGSDFSNLTIYEPPGGLQVTLYSTPVVGSKTISPICSGQFFSVNAVDGEIINGITNIVPPGTLYSWGLPTLGGGLTGGNTGINSGTISGTLTNPTNSQQNAIYNVTPISVNGCQGGTFTLTVPVNPTPKISSQSATICSGGTFSVTISDNSPTQIVPAGTTYSWSAPILSGSNGALTGGMSGSGNYISGTLTNSTNSIQTATYSVTPTSIDGCVGDVFTVTVTVKPKPNIANNPFIPQICNGTPFVFTPRLTDIVPTYGNGTLYTWTVIDNPNVNDESNVITPTSTFSQILTNIGSGVESVTYTVTPISNGCTGPDFTAVVSLIPSPVINGPISVQLCSGGDLNFAPVNVTNGIVPAGTQYTWSIGVNNNVNGQNDQLSNPQSRIIDNGIALANISNVPETLNYSVTTHTSGCSSTTFTLTVNVVPNASISSKTVEICSGGHPGITPGSGNFSSDIVLDGTRYTWSIVPNTNLIGFSAVISPTTSPSIDQTLTNRTNEQQIAIYNVSSVANTCASASFSVTVKVNPKATIANNIATPICSATTFSFTSVSGDIIPVGTTYTWSTPTVTGGITGGTSASAVGTISGTLTNPTSSAQTAVYSIVPLSGNCTGGTFTMSVTVNPKATIANNITSPVCSATSFTFSSTSGDIIPAGTTYSWSAPNVTGGMLGGIDVTGAGTISGTLTNPTNSAQTALYTIVPLSGNCTGGTFTMSVTVNPKATIANNIATPICSATTFSFTSVSGDIIPSGTTYTWSTPTVTGGITGGTSASSVGTISGTLTNPTNSAQTALYTIVPLSGNCTGGTFTMSVTVNPKATIANNITSPVCSATSFTFSSTSGDIIPAGTTYSWSAPNVTGGMLGGMDVTGAGTISGTLTNPTNSAQTALYTIVPLSGNCTGGTFTMSVTVNPKATIANNIATPICSATTFSFTSVSGDIIPLGTTYTWSTPTVTGGITGGTSASAVGTISGTLTNPTSNAQTALYTIVPLSGNCTGGTFTMSVIVNPKARIANNVATPICSNTTFNFVSVSGDIIPSGTTYSWSIPTVTGGITGGTSASSVGTISGTLTNPTNSAQTALYTIVPLSGNCTGGTFTMSVTVNPLPIAPSTTPVSVFYDGLSHRFNVSVNTGESIRWYNPSDFLLSSEPTYINANSIAYSVFASSVITATGCESANKTQASLTINKKIISANAIASDKVYDQNTNAVANINSNEVINGDQLTFAYSSAVFNNKNVGNNKLVTVSGVSISGGSSINNYSLNLNSSTLTSTANITAKLMTVIANVSDKVYDGTISATVTLSSPDLIVGDIVTFSYLTSSFNSKTAADNKSVLVTGITKSGIDAGNYTLTNTTASTTGKISQKELIVINSLTTSRVYNGTRVADVNNGVLQGVITPDIVNLTQTGLFDTKNVGVGKTIISTSTISGTDALNYFLTQPTLPTANITAKTISITGAIAANKIYDATTKAIVTNGQLQGIETIDVSTVNLSQSGTFASKDVGNNIPVTSTCTISGTDAPNYLLTQPLLVAKNITKKELTMSGLSIPTSKVYDATTVAVISGTPILQNMVTPGEGANDDGRPYIGDIVNISGTGVGTYNSKDVLTASKVTFSSLTLTGSQAGNYSLKIQDPISATITKKKLTMFGLSVADTKVYDGNRNAKVIGNSILQDAEGPGTGNATDGKPYTGDIVKVDGAPTALYNSKNVVEASKVSFAGLSLSGSQASNYELVIQDDYPAKITPLQIKLNANKQTKIYGDDDPEFTFTNEPIIEGDSFTGKLSRVEGQNVGAYSILQGNLDLGTNYTITYMPDFLVITEASLYIKPDTTYRTYGDEPLQDGLSSSRFKVMGLKYNETVKSVKLYFPTGLGSGNDPRDSVGVYLYGVLAKDPSGGTALSSNYKIVSFPGDIKVKQFIMTIKADPKSKRQSEQDPEFTYKLSAKLFNSDTLSGKLERDPGELPGTYPIRQGTLAINNNYYINYVYDMLTVLTVENIFVLPNAFTPNGDGLNDVLKILHNSSIVGINYFRIFDKSGKLVFETKNIEDGWDGRLNGIMQESDAYYWFAEFNTWNKLIFQRKGTVVLLK